MYPIQLGAREGRLEREGGEFGNQILAYFDDIDIIGLWLSYVVEAYQGIQQAAENLRLQINQTNGGNISGTSNNKSSLTYG